jgi:5-methylcytosine-specific restriction endonuclease McrA
MGEETQCPTCGRTDFASERGLKIHHKTAHDVSLKPRVACEQCGDDFLVKPRRIDTARFCSNECQRAFLNENHRKTMFCDWCGEEYEVIAAVADTTRFCSRECLSESRKEAFTGDKNPRWKGGFRTVSCEVCHKEYEVRAAKEAQTRFCSYECKGIRYREERRGKGNPRWKGGFFDIASRVRSLLGDTDWDRLAPQVRESECACCGAAASEDDRAHHVHHIVPVLAGGTNEDWNLMTLCPGCHRRVEEFTKSFTDPVLVDFPSVDASR